MTIVDAEQLLRADAGAVLATIALVDGTGEADLARPTPCAGWDVARLVRHLTAAHRGFAAAARGAGVQCEAWDEVDPSPDGLRADHHRAARDVLAAFSAPGVLGRALWIAPISTRAPLPGHLAVAAHLVDHVAHAWDLGRALDIEPGVDPDVVDTALQFALSVPDDDRRLAPGAAFGPAVPAGSDDPLDRLVAHLGRDPRWRAPARAAV